MNAPFPFFQPLPALLLAALTALPAFGLQQGSRLGSFDRLPLSDPGGGCDPPLPAAGQTVTWNRSQNPLRICQDTTIPVGATLRLASGVELQVDAGVTLTVAGELDGRGLPGARLRFSGAGTLRVEGRARLEHVRLQLATALGSRASLALHHADVPDAAVLTSFQRDAFLDLRDVTIDAGALFFFGPLALRDVVFANPGFPLDLGGYLLADGVRVYGSPLTVTADHQPRFLYDVDVLNPGASPALSVNGGGTNPGTNVLVDATCDLVGGTFPVQLRVGGLHPESVLPQSGNLTDAIDIGGWGAGSGVCDWPDLGLAYHATDDVSIQGRPRVAPGVRFELGDFAGLELRGNFFDDTASLRGAPGAPLLVRPLFPGAQHAGVALFNATAEHLDVDGGQLASISGFNAIRECTVHDAPVGIFGDSSAFGEVTGCTIVNNAVGAEDDPTSATALDLDGSRRPNVFEGNTIGARNNSTPGGNSGPFPAENNWWGHPSGPYSPFFNPAGEGDPVGFAVDAQPWRSVRPDLSDRPPFVTLDWPFLLAEPGDPLFVSWQAQDDGAIVSQRILMDVSGGGLRNWVVIEDGIDPARRSAIVTVPFVGQTPDARSTILRVEATDDSGHVGVHDITLQVPVLARPDGSVQFLNDTAQGLVPGEELPVCYSALGVAGSIRAYLVMDTEENALYQGPSGNAGTSQCTFSSLRVPRVSTDRARFLLFADGTGNDNDWYFSEPFAVRPHRDFPDAPPSVAMLAPTAGQRFAGGQVVPLAWDASDDEALRAFRVQASLNDGRTWSTVATLDGALRSYDWQLPTLAAAIEPVRVRIVAVDRRFQASTDGDDAAIAFDPGG